MAASPRQTPREALAAAGGRCHYCGNAIRKNQRPYVARFYADGTHFVGHRACYLEFKYPDDPRVGVARHDRKIGR